MAFILEQRDALERALQGYVASGNRVGRFAQIELRAVEPVIAQRETQNAQHLVVDGGFSFTAPLLTAGHEHLVVHEARTGHLKIEAVVGCCDAGRRSHPSRT